MAERELIRRLPPLSPLEYVWIRGLRTKFYIIPSNSKNMKLKWIYPTMDQWQKDLLELVKQIIKAKQDPKKFASLIQNFILLCGRQIGKSEIVGYCIALILMEVPKIKLLIVSGVERQASGLYNKVVNYIPISNFNKVKGGNPLRTKFTLKNRSELITEPVGTDGSGARQHTVNGIIFEEMQLIPEEAFAAITPMLLTTGGFIWMLGTAWDTEGYAYERLSDPDFKPFRINAEEIPQERPEPQRTIMIKFLEKERERMTEAQYMQEYLAIPSSKARQIFPDKLIKTLQVLKRENIQKQRRHVCGVDPAGLGEDEGAITILDTEDKERVRQVDFIITEKLLTTQTTDKVIELDKRYNFGKIYVDDGGVGFGVFSELIANEETKRKTIPLNNAQRPLDNRDEKRKRILKEDLYMNLLKMMERGRIQLLDDPEIRESLKSCKFEYHEKSKKLIITSTYNHPVESLIRAAWDAEGKVNKPWIASMPV